MAAPSRAVLDRSAVDVAVRRRRFWLVAGIVVFTAAVLIALSPGGGGEETVDESSSLPAPPPPAQPSELGSSTPPEAEKAGAQFADEYVRFAYGLTEPSQIENATPQLVAQLERENPRVPPAAQETAAEARATGIEFSPVTATIVEAVATVEAADSTYQLRFELRQQGQRWLVTDVAAG